MFEAFEAMRALPRLEMDACNQESVRQMRTLILREQFDESAKSN